MEALGPIGFFAAVAAIVWIVFHNKTKSQKQSFEIIEKMVDRGDKIDEDPVKALGVRPAAPERDLKIGMILVAIACGFFIFAGMIKEEEGQIALRGIGSFPLLVGLVYCVFWLMFGRNKS